MRKVFQVRPEGKMKRYFGATSLGRPIWKWGKDTAITAITWFRNSVAVVATTHHQVQHGDAVGLRACRRQLYTATITKYIYPRLDMLYKVTHATKNV